MKLQQFETIFATIKSESETLQNDNELLKTQIEEEMLKTKNACEDAAQARRDAEQERIAATQARNDAANAQKNAELERINAVKLRSEIAQERINAEKRVRETQDACVLAERQLTAARVEIERVRETETKMEPPPFNLHNQVFLLFFYIFMSFILY